MKKLIFMMWWTCMSLLEMVQVVRPLQTFNSNQRARANQACSAVLLMHYIYYVILNTVFVYIYIHSILHSFDQNNIYIPTKRWCLPWKQHNIQPCLKLTKNHQNKVCQSLLHINRIVVYHSFVIGSLYIYISVSI